MRKAASSEVQSETSAERDQPKRDRHGQNRGLPPPATFDFDALAPGAMLSEFETAATLRLSTNTLGSWRGKPDHPLKWLVLPNGFVRYTVGQIRAYLALGKPRRRSTTKPDAAPAPRGSRDRPRKPVQPPRAEAVGTAE